MSQKNLTQFELTFQSFEAVPVQDHFDSLIKGLHRDAEVHPLPTDSAEVHLKAGRILIILKANLQFVILWELWKLVTII